MRVKLATYDAFEMAGLVLWMLADDAGSRSWNVCLEPRIVCVTKCHCEKNGPPQPKAQTRKPATATVGAGYVLLIRWRHKIKSLSKLVDCAAPTQNHLAYKKSKTSSARAKAQYRDTTARATQSQAAIIIDHSPVNISATIRAVLQMSTPASYLFNRQSNCHKQRVHACGTINKLCDSLIYRLSVTFQ